MSSVEQRNPRYNRNFDITVLFGDYSVKGIATNPSSFGASIEISAISFEHLSANPSLWENALPINVKTSLNDLPATVNSIYEKDDKHYLSLKLLNNRSWYS